LPPTPFVAVTLLLAVAMTETELPKLFVTYVSDPSGVMASPCGAEPTVTVAATVLVAVSITETLLDDVLLT
jgi:hypothetical protein